MTQVQFNIFAWACFAVTIATLVWFCKVTPAVKSFVNEMRAAFKSKRGKMKQ